MEKTSNVLNRLELLKKREQFIVNMVGKQKFADTINALEKISVEFQLQPLELLTITELYRLGSLLPVVERDNEPSKKISSKQIIDY